MDGEQTKTPSARLKRNLRLLLTRAYEIPEYSDEFRDSLLERLKEKQRELAFRRKMLTFRPAVIGASSGVAAAAILLLAALPILSHFNQQNPSTGTSTPTTLVAQNNTEKPKTPKERKSINQYLAQDNTYSNEPIPTIEFNPNAEITAVGEGTNHTIPLHGNKTEGSVPFERATTPDKLPDMSNLKLTPHDNIEYLPAGNAATWKTAAKDDALQTGQIAEVRTPANEKVSGMWFGKDDKLVMHRGTVIKTNPQSLEIEKGSIYIKTADNGDGVVIKVAGRDVLLTPGSLAHVKVIKGERYADGGEPAPFILVLKGKAIILKSGQALSAGYMYDFFDTLTGVIPGRSAQTLSRCKPQNF